MVSFSSMLPSRYGLGSAMPLQAPNTRHGGLIAKRSARQRMQTPGLRPCLCFRTTQRPYMYRVLAGRINMQLRPHNGEWSPLSKANHTVGVINWTCQALTFAALTAQIDNSMQLFRCLFYLAASESSSRLSRDGG